MFNGAILVGGEERRHASTFRAAHPASGAQGEAAFANADDKDVRDACGLAAAAAPAIAGQSPAGRAAFLEAVGDEIDRIGDILIETAMAETGLPRVRLEGERGRTINQLRMFADHVRSGEWLDATIDPAQPDRKPLPRPDLRRLNLPLGPVGVFGASNFPLAFSVAGVDTAAAFAAGCPVVVKGHHAHPGTGELVARAIIRAVARAGLPGGTFSYLPGAPIEIGAALVADPRIKAVGFTGSRGGGVALMRIAADRSEPIPVFAEMSSINPVVLLPGALAERAEALGAAFVGSLTLGAGQFCTNPGLVIAIEGPDLERFVKAASEAIRTAVPAPMLTTGIHAGYEHLVAQRARHPRVTRIAEALPIDGPNRAIASLFGVDAAALRGDLALQGEVFGPSSILVRCASAGEAASVLDALEGQLTAGLHMAGGDEELAARLLPVLQGRAGRVLVNGWPTGVEVTAAMVHGGPFPATSDGRSSSVGTLAMMRFLRPVCFQDVPDALLPPALQAANPWKIVRRVDDRLELPR